MLMENVRRQWGISPASVTLVFWVSTVRKVSKTFSKKNQKTRGTKKTKKQIVSFTTEENCTSMFRMEAPNSCVRVVHSLLLYDVTPGLL